MLLALLALKSNNNNILCSLSRALAEGKSPKDAVDRRNSVSPS